MTDRRMLILTAPAALVLSRLPALARDNPMPESLRRDLERDPNAPVLGNPKGDITLTEFFDYNCHFCRQMVGLIPELIASDPGLRVVFRELPVFGEGSYFAARAALAALDQGKYWQMHAGLMTMKDRAVEASVMRVARGLGLDADRLRRDMDSARVAAHLDRSLALADHMGLRGTPSFICGDEAAFGATDLRGLQDLVARGRRTLG